MLAKYTKEKYFWKICQRWDKVYVYVFFLTTSWAKMKFSTQHYVPYYCLTLSCQTIFPHFYYIFVKHFILYLNSLQMLHISFHMIHANMPRLHFIQVNKNINNNLNWTSNSMKLKNTFNRFFFVFSYGNSKLMFDVIFLYFAIRVCTAVK